MTNIKGDIQAYVIHVRGQEERRQFMQPQLDALGFPYEYILDGNKEELTADILDNYFADNGQPDTMHGQYPRTSCAYKAFLAYQKLLESGQEGALVFEDDIRLFSRFYRLLPKILDEISKFHADEPLIANFEESSLLLVSRSKRKEGQYLYKMERDRFAGCYYINRKAAQAITDYLKKNKCDLPLDRFHTKLVTEGLINYYWSYPCLALQCSCDGSMPTMIPTKPRPFKRLKWFYKRVYKHLLYWFR